MRLRRRAVHRLAMGTGLAWIARSGHAQPSPPAAPDTGLQPLLAERLRHEGVALAAARFGAEGPPVLATAARAGAAPIGAERHRFEIGSITKVFVGLLLAEAARRRELRLDDAVEEVLGQPLRDVAGQPLRWVDLATHRSGLPRLPANLRPARETDPYVDYGDEALREALRDFRPGRRRDDRFEYSNLGFGLLGWLLARRAGQAWPALVQSRIGTPLGLGALIEPRAATDADTVAVQGHDAQGQPVPAWNFSEATAGAGALRLSAAQLAAFGRAALGRGDGPLRDAFVLSLQPHSSLGPGPGAAMGLGWLLATAEGRRQANHDGGTGGFSSSLWLDLDRGRGGLVLANAAVPVGDLARHLMDERQPLRDIAAERRLRSQAAVGLSAQQLAPLAGIYAVSPSFEITVRARGGQLFAQATGQGEIELFALSPRRFFARVAPLELQFDGAEGVPAGLVLHQGGRQTGFVRRGSEVAAVLPGAEELRPLAGSYALNPTFKLSLRADGQRLFAQATGQGEFELFRRQGREFHARITPLTVRFDAGDPAPALTLLQAGSERRFVRE